MRAATRKVLRERYGDLVRLACLILDDGLDTPKRLLAVAQRAVLHTARQHTAWEHTAQDTAEVTDSSEIYAELRRELVAHLVRPAGRRWRGWARQGNVPAEVGPTRQALRPLSRHERIVYLLVRLDELTAPEVAAELSSCLAVTPRDVDHTVTAVDTATGRSDAQQRAELLAFDPTLVRLQPDLSDRRRRIAVAGALVVVVGGGFAYALWHRAGAGGDPLVVAADAWRKERAPGLAVWPTQGDRSGDRTLLRRARDAWTQQRPSRPLGPVTVMFAGVVGDATTVVMHDAPGGRTAPTVAHYVERPLTHGVEDTRRVEKDAAQIVVLDSANGRFLVPPWRTDLRVATLAGRRPRWQPVRVQHGVSDPIALETFDPRCQFYVALQLTDLTGSRPRTVTQLASFVPEWTTPEVSFRSVDPANADETALDSDRRWQTLHTTVCSRTISPINSGDLRIGELWQGPLPDGGGRARLVTVDAAGDRTGVSLLLAEDSAVLAQDGATNSDYTARGDETAAAVWWWSSHSQRWYLVVAAAQHLAMVEVVDDLGRREMTGRSLIVPGPPADSPIRSETVPPVVQVVAHEGDGDRTVVRP